MATLYKRQETRPVPEGAAIVTHRGRPHAQWTDPRTGRTRRAPLNPAGDRMIRTADTYTVQYFDEHGRRRKAPTGCADKASAQMVADGIERDVALRRRGHIDPAQERLTEAARRPLAEHLAEFRGDLAARGNTAKHVRMTNNHIVFLAAATNAGSIRDLTGPTIQRAIGDLRTDGRSLRTCNAYLRSVKSFTRWLWRDKRLPDDPLAGLSAFNADTDPRHIRRELTPEELVYLLDFTRGYTTPMHNLPGPDRAMVYRLALGTGFRASELRSLTPASFGLDSDPPTVTVAAAYSKRRRLDVQPIRQDLAELLRPWLRERPRDAAVFGDLPQGTARMMRQDLAAARMAWIDQADTPEERERRERSDFLRAVDHDGRLVDFHATRHTYVSGIVAGGASVKTAQELARHSTPVLTIGRYSHARLHDLTGALEALPEAGPLDEPKPHESALQATGTDEMRGQMRGHLNGNMRRNGAKRGKTPPQDKRDDDEVDTGPKLLPMHVLGEKGRDEAGRGAGGIRTPDGGFAIRCLSHLATAPCILQMYPIGSMGSSGRMDPSCGVCLRALMLNLGRSCRQSPSMARPTDRFYSGRSSGFRSILRGNSTAIAICGRRLCRLRWGIATC